MKRRLFLTGLMAGLVIAGPALAQDYAGDIITQLRRQGFTSVTASRTLLGRVRIWAERGDGSREIVVNPRTGEILRDVWLSRGGVKGSSEIIGDDDSSDDDDDDDDDDDNDDDDDDDNSGHGSGGDDDGDDSSGSGGGDDDD